MNEMMAWGSWSAGVALLVLSALGLRAFIPKALRAPDAASRMLGWAICLGFLSAGLNTAYWQVGGRTLILSLGTAPETVRVIGWSADVVFKGAAAVAVYLHLAAWRASLPARERARWSVLGMTFYPAGSHWLVRALNILNERSER